MNQNPLEQKIALAIRRQTHPDLDIRYTRAVEYIVAILRANGLTRTNVFKLRTSLLKDVSEWRYKVFANIPLLSTYLYDRMLKRGDVFSLVST